MKRSTCGRTLGAAAVSIVSVLAMSFTGVAAQAAPEPAPTEQALADLIAAGRKAAPVADSGSAGSSGSACTSGSGAGSGNGSGDCYGGSGSSSGSSGGFASDTVGYGPPMTSWLAAFGYGLLNPDVAPPGANDWNCKPTASTPVPW